MTRRFVVAQYGQLTYLVAKPELTRLLEELVRVAVDGTADDVQWGDAWGRFERHPDGAAFIKQAMEAKE